jgi:hypothetical protein
MAVAQAGSFTHRYTESFFVNTEAAVGLGVALLERDFLEQFMPSI